MMTSSAQKRYCSLFPVKPDPMLTPTDVFTLSRHTIRFPFKESPPISNLKMTSIYPSLKVIDCLQVQIYKKN